MRTAYQIDLRDPARALAQQNDLLNRDAARSHTVATPIPTPQTLTLTEESYLAVTFPLDVGTTLRAARLIPAGNYTIARTGAYLAIGVGLLTSTRFELLGREWSSRSQALVTGTPFDLVTDEQPIRDGLGLVVRVTRNGWPASWPINASVVSTLGYDPGA